MTHASGRSFDLVLRSQAASNRNAARHADLYAGHRARLTAEIEGLAGAGGGRLCLLGAGSCLDVDLEGLADRFGEIHLVDIDPDALAAASARQSEAVRVRLALHAPVDLSGLLGRLDGWRGALPTLAQLDAAVEPAVAAIAAALPGPFDAVASCCLATQLSRAVTEGLGTGHASAADVRRRVATIHLRTLAALLAPGGRALHASDLVSNETYPLDELPPEADLEALAAELVRQGNFFFGADPVMMSQILRRDPVLAAAVAPARPIAPWLWRAGPERVFLVTGFALERRGGG